MKVPTLTTPAELQLGLKQRGIPVGDRRLRDWRQPKQFLPPLTDRGRGKGLGKHYFWRHPKIIEQGTAAFRLQELKYPVDAARLAIWLLGYSVESEHVRSAWLASLGKLKHKWENESRRAVKRHGGEFIDPEDKISALATPYARMVASHFRIDFSLLEQLSIDIVGLVFFDSFKIEIEDAERFAALAELFLNTPLSTSAQLDPKEFISVVNFLSDTMSFDAVMSTVVSSTDKDLARAHRYWRQILDIMRIALPELDGTQNNSAKLTAGQFLAIKFGRLCVPALVKFIKEGKASEIANSIREIRHFILRYDIGDIFQAILFGNGIDAERKIALRNLVDRLGQIWNYRGFPFSIN
jgi:hypothetical protein